MDFERYQQQQKKKTGKKTLKAIFLGFQLEKKGRRPESNLYIFTTIQGMTKVSFESLQCPLSINIKISIFKFGSL